MLQSLPSRVCPRTKSKTFVRLLCIVTWTCDPAFCTSHCVSLYEYSSNIMNLVLMRFHFNSWVRQLTDVCATCCPFHSKQYPHKLKSANDAICSSKKYFVPSLDCVHVSPTSNCIVYISSFQIQRCAYTPSRLWDYQTLMLL